MKEEECGSSFARSYDTGGEHVVGKAILQAIEEKLLSEQALGNAVELGCGTVCFTRAIARNVRRVLATDLSDQMLAVARTQMRGGRRNVTVQVADCAPTSLASEGFVSVVTLNLLDTQDNPTPCLHVSHRILRSGGLLIVVDFSGRQMTFADKMGLGFGYMRKWGLPLRGGRRDMCPDESAALVESGGFTVQYVQLLPGGANALYLRAAKE